MKLRVKKLNENAILPEYQTAGAAGADIHACIDKPITLQPLDRHLIPTGIAFEVPGGYEVQIRARSGMGLKFGITMVNGVGTIDSDYRGEIGVLLINLGHEPFVVEPGMRIAQMILAPYEKAIWLEVDELDATVRGEGGFGSTKH